MKTLQKWLMNLTSVGSFLLLPLTAPALTTYVDVPAPTVEQATYAYDIGSVRVAFDNVLAGLEASGQPSPFLGQAAGLVAAKSGVQAYEVGTANALKARSVVGDTLDIHHVGQATPLEQLVPGYSRATGPAIALPEVEHGLIPTVRGTTTMSARDVLATDIRNLRNLTEAPNSSLQELIRLNKEMYPGAYAK